MKSTIYTLLILIIPLTGCSSDEDLSTDTISTIFKSDSQKIAFMEKYYSPEFPYLDVEYHIMYHDNDAGWGIPGPSDWTMFFAFKLEKSEIHKLNVSKHLKTINVESWESFLPKNEKWDLCYPIKNTSEGDIVIPENGIFLIKISIQ